MLTVNAVDVYEQIKPRLGDRESRSLLQFIEDRTVFLVQEEIAKGLVTRDDLLATQANLKQGTISLRSELKQDIANLRTELKQDIANLRTELKQDIADLRTELKQDIADLRAELKQDIAGVEQRLGSLQEEIANLKQEQIRMEARLEKRIEKSEWHTRLLLIALGALIVVTNPNVLDLLGKLVGVVH